MRFARIVAMFDRVCNKKFVKNAKFYAQRAYKRKSPYDRSSRLIPLLQGEERGFFFEFRLIRLPALSMKMAIELESGSNPQNTERTMTEPKKPNKRTNKSPVGEFVTVAFAEDAELARYYKKLLEENGISAFIRQPESAGSSSPGIAVLVPEEVLDEAHSLIASQAPFEDFFDVFFHGSDEWLEEREGEEAE